MKHWIEIRADFDEPPADWSPIADAFDRHGCPGSIQSDHPAYMSGYLGDVPGAAGRADLLADELRRLGASAVVTTLVPEEDWSELWKIHFKARRVGRRFIVRPTWEDYRAEPNDLVIVLDPGQAFGTGDHPTTRLCLELMEDSDLSGKTVADVGCGSGILSIGACLLGARSVVASDLDAQSVEVSIQNAELNGQAFPCILGSGFTVLAEPQDVVISNIISATLIRLAPEAAQAVKPGGLWIVSGIIGSNWPDVLKAANRVGFELLRFAEEDDWVAGVLRRAG